jgi:hypothetical protein
MKKDPMEDAFDDDIPFAGPGIAYDVDEGQDVPIGDAGQHKGHRYRAKKRGIRMIITKEAVKDNKYKKSIKFAFMMRRAMARTKEIKCVELLQRGFDTNYPMVDSQPLWSASQTLRGGGTFSNKLASATAPSIAALILLRTQAKTMAGFDGEREGYKIKAIGCPVDQEDEWMALVGSKYDTDTVGSYKTNIPGRFMKMDDVIGIPEWSNTTTNYCVFLDVEEGFKMRQRDPVESNTWVTESRELMNHQATERYDVGCSDPRASIGVEA